MDRRLPSDRGRANQVVPHGSGRERPSGSFRRMTTTTGKASQPARRSAGGAAVHGSITKTRRAPGTARCFWVSATTFRTRLRPAWLRPCTWAIPRRNRNHPTSPNLEPVQTIRASRRAIDFYGGELRIEQVEVFDDAVVNRWDVTPDLDIWQAFPVESAELEADLEEVADEWAVEELRKKATSGGPGYSGTPIWPMTPVPLPNGWFQQKRFVERSGRIACGWPRRVRPAPTTRARRSKWTWLSTTLENPLR